VSLYNENRREHYERGHQDDDPRVQAMTAAERVRWAALTTQERRLEMRRWLAELMKGIGA
jgi:hypothetical protein